MAKKSFGAGATKPGILNTDGGEKLKEMQAKIQYNFKYIPKEKIVSNPKNEMYTQDGIEALKESILINGLRHNLSVFYFLACLSDILSCFAISAFIFLISPFIFSASYNSFNLLTSHLFTSIDDSRTSWLAEISIISSSISVISDFSTLQGMPAGNRSLYSLSLILVIA